MLPDLFSAHQSHFGHYHSRGRGDSQMKKKEKKNIRNLNLQISE